MHLIALLGLAEVAAEAVIAFEIADAWLDLGEATEPPSGFAPRVEGAGGSRGLGCNHLGMATRGFAAVAAIVRGIS